MFQTKYPKNISEIKLYETGCVSGFSLKFTSIISCTDSFELIFIRILVHSFCSLLAGHICGGLGVSSCSPGQAPIGRIGDGELFMDAVTAEAGGEKHVLHQLHSGLDSIHLLAVWCWNLLLDLVYSC